MNIHEYQAKTILSSYVPVPRGAVALNIGEIKSAVAQITTPIIVVKSQIHAGGRGKAGGVKLAKSKEEAERDRLREKQKDIGRALRASGSLSSSVYNVVTRNVNFEKTKDQGKKGR